MVNIAPHLTNTYLNLIILPTEKCNFRCTYCYEDFEIGKMKPELIDSVKKLIDARIQDLDTLEISWFGGEPLLAKEIIYDLMNHAQKIKKVFGKTLKSNMTTNAYLLDSESFKELVDRGVNVFQITLDGPSIDHNKSRILANGGDTFSKVVRNLEYISKTSFDFEVLLRIHYHPRNLKQLESLFRELPSSIVQDVRFKFFFKAIHHLGGENDSEFSVYSEYEEKTLTQNLNELAVKYSFNFLLNMDILFS